MTIPPPPRHRSGRSHGPPSAGLAMCSSTWFITTKSKAPSGNCARTPPSGSPFGYHVDFYELLARYLSEERRGLALAEGVQVSHPGPWRRICARLMKGADLEPVAGQERVAVLLCSDRDHRRAPGPLPRAGRASFLNLPDFERGRSIWSRMSAAFSASSLSAAASRISSSSSAITAATSPRDPLRPPAAWAVLRLRPRRVQARLGAPLDAPRDDPVLEVVGDLPLPAGVRDRNRRSCARSRAVMVSA